VLVVGILPIGKFSTDGRQDLTRKARQSLTTNSGLRRSVKSHVDKVQWTYGNWGITQLRLFHREIDEMAMLVMFFPASLHALHALHAV
jgi:hypothetical protein